MIFDEDILQNPASTIILCVAQPAIMRQLTRRHPNHLIFSYAQRRVRTKDKGTFTVARNGYVAVLPVKVARVLALVASGRGRVISDDELAASLFGDLVDGGPLALKETIRQAICHAAPVAAALGIKISFVYGRGVKAVLTDIPRDQSATIAPANPTLRKTPLCDGAP